ncbi:MAG: hypothetical protein AB8G11_03405 [Saprospiraceae bacterium]
MNSRFTILFLALSILTIVACKKDKKSADENQTPIIAVTIDDEQATPRTPDASANFEINEYFETFIAKNNNNESIVNIDKPKMNGELLRKADKVKVDINGYWVNDANKSEIILEVYPNAFEVGNSNRPIIEQKLKLKRKNKFLMFSYLKMIALEEGLYYYFLKDNDTLIYVGKFIVK